jgi:hypothetical protein
MKKSFYKAAKYGFAAIALAVFLASCANPLSDNSLPNVSGSAKALVAPSVIEQSNYKDVLLLDSATVDTLKIDREPVLGEVVGGVIEVTKLYYKGSEVIGFDFVSSTPVLAVYVKASDGGNLYDYRPNGVTSDTELFTPTNSSGTNAGISHVDFAWVVSGTGDDDGDDPVVPVETISGFVFHDVDKDGVKDAGEVGLANVSVTLSNGVVVTSSADGSYTFSQLFAQQYTVASGLVDGYYRTNADSFTVTASAQNVNFGFTYETISGFVFYDSNNNGVKDFGEPALSNVNVTLDKDGTPVSVASGVDGSYSFAYLLPKTYNVSVAGQEGFVHSNPSSQSDFATANNVNFGFFVDYNWLNGKTANGFTIGYWKNNVDKAIANSTRGIQVSKSTLLGYLGTLSNFALSPLNFPATVDGLKQASVVLSDSSSDPAALLAKQLVGSEFNYASGAYIGGNALATSFFLYQGEYMLANASSFTSAQLVAQKDLYDAYNNSHGGAVSF